MKIIGGFVIFMLIMAVLRDPSGAGQAFIETFGIGGTTMALILGVLGLVAFISGTVMSNKARK